MIPRLSLPALAVALAVTMTACSGGDDTSSSPGTRVPVTTVAAPTVTGDGAGTTVAGPATTLVLPTSPSDRIGCDVRISGALTAEFTAKDNAAALASDYYLSQAEIDHALGLGASDTTVTLPAGLTVPPRPEGAAPLIAWFLLNCQGGDITLNIYSQPSSTSADVPFKKGRYEIAAGTAPGSDAPFAAFIVFGANPEPTNWAVDDGATISIDRFDPRGAKGSFDIPMRELDTAGNPTDQTIQVEGSFEVTCKDGDNCRA